MNLTDAEAAAVKEFRAAYLKASSTLQAEIHKLVLGEQNLFARHPAIATFSLVIFGAVSALFLRWVI